MRKLCHFAQHDILILRSNLLFVAMVIDHPRTLEQWRAGNVNAAGHQLPWKRPQGIQTLGQTTAKPCPQCRLHMPIGIISFEYFPGWEHFMRVLISCTLLIFFLVVGEQGYGSSDSDRDCLSTKLLGRWGKSWQEAHIRVITTVPQLQTSRFWPCPAGPVF